MSYIPVPLVQIKQTRCDLEIKADRVSREANIKAGWESKEEKKGRRSCPADQRQSSLPVGKPCPSLVVHLIVRVLVSDVADEHLAVFIVALEVATSHFQQAL